MAGVRYTTSAWGFRRCSVLTDGQCEGLYSVDRAKDWLHVFYLYHGNQKLDWQCPGGAEGERNIIKKFIIWQGTDGQLFHIPSKFGCSHWFLQWLKHIRCHLSVSESDKIVFCGMEAKEIDATIPNGAFINNGSMKWKMDNATLIL